MSLYFVTCRLDRYREIADPANEDIVGNVRFVELFNLGCEDIDLSAGYSLRRFTNALTVASVWQDAMAMTAARYRQWLSVLRLMHSLLFF